MTTSVKNIEPKQPLFSPLLTRRMIACALVGLIVVSIFVIGAGEGNPAWGKYWRIKPLLLTPTLCAIVGLCYDITQPLRDIKGWRGNVLFILSLLAMLVGLWMSLILGLNGTMWD
ncbi:hypothetical protein [Pedobacter deserti]|uniref:hypothetical protein n=1 Tax=Pedobacter deserti TaxID=2817382 RepID=UPI00210D1D09|nr:hypothetical protein [Pedobacter sp. SYSU D00382]